MQVVSRLSGVYRLSIASRSDDPGTAGSGTSPDRRNRR